MADANPDKTVPLIEMKRVCGRVLEFGQERVFVRTPRGRTGLTIVPEKMFVWSVPKLWAGTGRNQDPAPLPEGISAGLNNF